MADTVYLTPVGTPPLSPTQAFRKRKPPYAVDPTTQESAQPKKAPRPRIPKTNQTKSRNGARRRVECEGYKKEFKWRDFPEQNIGRKLAKAEAPPKTTKRTDNGAIETSASILQQALEACNNQDGDCIDTCFAAEPELNLSTNDGNLEEQGTGTFTVAFQDQQTNLGRNQSRCSDQTLSASDSGVCLSHNLSDPLQPQSTNAGIEPMLANSDNADVCLGFNHFPTNDSTQWPPRDQFPNQKEANYGSHSETNSGLSDSQLCTPPSPMTSTKGCQAEASLRATKIGSRTSNLPKQVDLGSTSSENLVHRFFNTTSSVMTIFSSMAASSYTINNPWQSLIWPLVRNEETPMLYHALMSMACFHNYQHRPSLRLEGIEQMRKSRHILYDQQQWRSAPIEVTLATCIALAFSESWTCWKRNIKSGSEHIKIAKQCLMQALHQGAQTRMQKRQLRFLCKTYLYVDVIARLTSTDEDTGNDAFDAIAGKIFGIGRGRHTDNDEGQNENTGFINENSASHSGSENDVTVPLDPLMGSASTLFPIVGQVANLVRRVYRQSRTGLSHITEGQTLASRLTHWVPSPNSSSGSVLHAHAALTAEAYRHATLLHLHQSIPELMMSDTLSKYSDETGLRILNLIARIPPTSGTIIVHIYPLLVGGCEAQRTEDREWVRNRWRSMEGRMGIGNVEKAREVVEEVWARRDKMKERGGVLDETLIPQVNGDGLMDDLGADEDFSFDDLFGTSLGGVGSVEDMGCFSFGSPTNAGLTEPTAPAIDMDQELTIRGRLHWARVMKDWGWEVLLG
ncbi:MAG: hypothetical protein Q9162_005912 [Coniocarpon cinnabarinum]